MSNTVILGIRVKDDAPHADALQRIFTRYGCVIRTRLGLPSQDDTSSTDKGLILLELIGDDQEKENLEKALSSQPFLIVKKMVI